MKYLYLLCLLLSGEHAISQKKNAIYGNWVKIEVVFKNGEQLTADDIRKYEYLKFIFTEPDKFSLSYSYDYKGSPFTLKIYGDTVHWGANKVLVEKLTADSLIFVQELGDKFDDPHCLRYYFVSEPTYQKTIPLKVQDIISATSHDTLYRGSEKIYAIFKDNHGFGNMVSETTRGLQSQTPVNDHFLATFTIDKNGETGNVQIVNSINPDFDKQFLKTFKKAKNEWAPAIYNGKAVAVQMKYEAWFTPYQKLPAFQKFYDLATDAMYSGNYQLALFDFEKALKSYGNGEIYYRMALCAILINDLDKACGFMQKSAEFDYTPANGLIKKYCH
jgi:hypothetical protein